MARSTGDFTENLQLLEQYQPAGLLLFAKDLAGLSEKAVKERLAIYRQARPGLLLAIDQEGGLVSACPPFTQTGLTPAKLNF
ncbi:hypothetical protein [Lactobacillus delbrueckii]|uniref:hypothetical protein n=1 Tax=Lactobacillus delbrueckii TaxID=1584 RepID=UPI001E30B7F9|nr:hypothetical protein [Lactobacillus delbrueckii]MCD5549609.1 hypothetical protein [Lactobacillus delbrueckii subsp. lactis]